MVVVVVVDVVVLVVVFLGVDAGAVVVAAAVERGAVPLAGPSSGPHQSYASESQVPKTKRPSAVAATRMELDLSSCARRRCRQRPSLSRLNMYAPARPPGTMTSSTMASDKPSCASAVGAGISCSEATSV